MLQWQGMHVGIMGLVERDWLATLATINEEVLMLLCAGVLPPRRVLCLLCAVLYKACQPACHRLCRGGHVFDICSASGAAACSRLVYVVPDLASASYKSVQDVTYLDFIDEGRRLAQQLRSDGCQLIVALTHMRMPNDRLLRDGVPEIDLVLGGHDHHVEVCNGTGGDLSYIIKSGTDFRDLTLLHVDGAQQPVQVRGFAQLTCWD